ncbi:hypothetical protein Tco_0508444 [Tanacetum coccineum]
MGNEELSTIPEKESDEFIKSSVEDLILILREFEDTSGSDSENVLPSSDDFSPIFEEKSVTLSNPLFDSNNFTSSDNELLSDEGISEDVKIYSNPLFEFDDEYISSDVNPLFDEVLENIESKDSYVSNLDDLALLVTPLFGANEDECFDPGGVIDEIDAFLDMDISTDIENGYHDSEGDIIYLESLLIDDTSPNLPPEVFLDHDPRSLKDEPDNDDLMIEDKVFDPGIHEKSFSPTFVKLTFVDHHYFPITTVIRIFLPYLTYSVDSSFLLSSGSSLLRAHGFSSFEGLTYSGISGYRLLFQLLKAFPRLLVLGCLVGPNRELFDVALIIPSDTSAADTWQRWPPFDSTVDWWSTTVDQWFDGDPAVVNGGSLLLIVVDRRHDLHRPPLTGGLVVALVTAPELLTGHVAPITG